MNTKIVSFVFVCISLSIISGISQIAPDTYWVSFTNKSGSHYTINKPEEFLTERSIHRREKQHISITQQDLPVSQIYLDSLKALGLKIHCVSKWLNGAVILSTDNALIDTLNHLSFVASPLKKATFSAEKTSIDKLCLEPKTTIEYGSSEKQISMIMGQTLHNSGYLGKGILIGILDAGFYNYNSSKAFDSLNNNSQIIATRDIVNDSNGFYSHIHGSLILSIIAGIIPGETYGSGTKADFLLIRTEKGSSENLVEEYYWASGAEYADSMGVDIIQSSLGYSLFDSPAQNHSYADMNGRTCPISIAATIAAKAGILVVSSAGNSGSSKWGYITAPADADSILAIGAVDSLERIAPFSSRGPSFDGRVKPDICAMGVSTSADFNTNEPRTCSGTSCSTPVISGLAACLWQANPDATAQEIRNAIITSCSRIYSPDTAYGFGIPNFYIAQKLLQNSKKDTLDEVKLSLIPNPVHKSIYFTAEIPWLKSAKSGIFEVLDLNGRVIKTRTDLFETGYNLKELDVAENLERGYYILRLTIEGRNYQLPFIKI